jgi:uncharacterized repeat protein (TIGR01451 family)
MPLPRPALRLALTALLAALALALALSLVYADNLKIATETRRALSDQMPSVPSVSLWLSSTTPLRKIDPALRRRLLAAAPDERIPIVIEMREQVDLDRAPGAAPELDQAEAIVAALQATAARSQVGVRSFLAQAAIAGRASHVRPLWIFNGLAARVIAGDIAALAQRDDVSLIREDRHRQWITDYSTARLLDYPTTVEWGIRQIRADEVWAALDVSGTGVVVANMDTGVDWQHPALQGAYRGYAKGLVSHIGNWFDATDGGAQYPIDPHGHGTHTLGTIAGGDGVGVAPGAKWIAARVLNAGGFGYDSWIHAGFQWILAPNGDPSRAPDVLNNSWGSTVSSDTTFQGDLRALRSAGIFAVFSSGNSGPGASTVGSPASLPEAFAVGATDDEDGVAGFSSRGPSPWGQVRPHVVAPGVNVRSSLPGGTYANASGTSMAAPHVAGAAALMLSISPALTITDTAYALTHTAVPLSTTIPNNDSGYGRIDAYAAVQSVAGLGAISGTLTRSDTGAPIAGGSVVAVSSLGGGGAATTDANGRYARGLAPAAYTVTASAFGYFSATQTNVFVITGATTLVDFALAPLPSGEVRGALTDAESGLPISGTIVATGTPVTTTAAGAYSLTLPGGAYTLRALAAGHRILTASATITPGQVVTQDFALPPAPSILLVDSGAWHYGSQIGYYRAALDELGYLYAEHRVKNLYSDVPLSTTLAPYDVVIWSAPQDAPGFIGAGDAISAYLSAGGWLFLSGQDVGFWDGGLSLNWSPYYYERLKALAVQDHSGSHALTGTGIFAGIDVSIEGSGGASNQLYPDAIASADPDATADAFRYANGLLGAQSVGLCLPYRAVYLGFGFEAISSAPARREVMSRALDHFGSPRNSAGMTLTSRDDLLVAPAGGTATTTVRLRNVAEYGVTDTFTLTAQSPGWSVSLSDDSIALPPCGDRTITVTTSIPPGTPRNVSQTITLAARSTLSPALSVSDTLVVKSPAIALLVDDDRWYDVEAAYQAALSASGVTFDRWDVPKSWSGSEPGTPSPDRLGWYPFVVWFTGYDWYQPLTANNQMTLTQYLDAGGRLLLSSQSHLGTSGLSDFNRARLGVLDGGDVTTTLARAPSAPIGAGAPGSPFDGLGALVLSYTFPNFSENAAPYPTATVALVGSHGRPIALARESGAGKALFFSFPFEAIAEADRPAVMERAIGYLSWLGGSSVSADRAIAAPGSSVTVTVAARNDGPAALSSVAFTATLPPGVSLQSGSLNWSGSLAAGQVITAGFSVALDGGLSPGSLVTIPVRFADGDHAIAFTREVIVGVDRPDLSAGAIEAQANPARSADVVTWTLVARNSGPADAPVATITGLLPLGAHMLSGTLAASAGAAGELSGTVQWSGPISAGASITITYQMTVPLGLAERLYYGGALFDDGVRLSQAATWLRARPHRFYLPLIRK